MRNKAPPPSPAWVQGKEWETDKAAREEKSKWPDQAALKGTKDANTIRLLKHSGFIAVCLMWFFAIVFVSSMVIWLFHFLTPIGWLEPEQLSKIQTVIFSGSLSAAATAFAQKHISSDSSRGKQ